MHRILRPQWARNGDLPRGAMNMIKIFKILGCSCLVSVLVAVIVHVATLDGLNGFVWSCLFQEDTLYASGYSDHAFRLVRKGMSEAEVRSLLGNPLELYPPDRFRDWTSIRFSKSPGGTHYRSRVVNVRGGVVIGKLANFYVD